VLITSELSTFDKQCFSHTRESLGIMYDVLLTILDIFMLKNQQDTSITPIGFTE